jgi:hypothetical protein
MKQWILFCGIIISLGLVSCKKQKTCATYAKETKEVKVKI